MLTSWYGVGFYSLMIVGCLAIPQKRRRSNLVHVFFFCLFLSRFTGLILILNPKKKEQ